MIYIALFILLQNEATLYYHEGLKHLQEGNYTHAIKSFKKAIKYERDNANLWYLLGASYLSIGEPESARKSLERSKELNPSNWVVLYNLGLSYKLLGDLEKAIYYIKSSLKLNPSRFEILHELANLYLKANRDSAKKYLHMILQQGKDKEAYNALGTIYASSDEFDSAVYYYKLAVEMDTTDPVSLLNFGFALSQKGEYAKSIPVFKKVITLDSLNQLAWFNLGVAYFHTQKFSEAEKAFLKSTKLNPEDWRAWNNLALTYFELGKTKDADYANKVAWHLRRKEAINTHRALADSFYKLGKYIDALNEYKKAYELDTTDAELAQKIESLKVKIKDWETAIRIRKVEELSLIHI